MSFQQLPSATEEKLRRKIGSRIGEFTVALSAVRARWRLSKYAPLSLLVDNSVLGHSVTHGTVWVSTGIQKWGVHEIAAGYAARVPVHSARNNTQTYKEIRYLPGIAYLAKHEFLRIFTSAELEAERFRQPIGRFMGYGYYDLGLFNGIRMNSLDGHKIDLVDSRNVQLQRIKECDSPIFRGLLDLLGEKNSLDAFHIYTAELHGMYCFLHMDFRLTNLIRQLKFKKPISTLRTRIMTPSELGRSLGLMPVHTRYLTDQNASFPTRSDMHVSSQRRGRGGQ